MGSPYAFIDFRGLTPFVFTVISMNSLTHIEKQKLERELGMGGGYVLDYSNRTFEEFFREVVGVEIYDPCYSLGSGSKANRMRAFWQVATDAQLRLLLNGLIEGWDIYSREQISNTSRDLLDGLLKKLGGNSDSSTPSKGGAVKETYGPLASPLVPASSKTWIRI